MLKRKKSIAIFLAMVSAISISGIGTSIPVGAAELNDYIERNDCYVHEGKDSNGLTWEYFNNNNGTVTLLGTSDLSSTVEVPSELEGHKVTGLKSVVRLYRLSFDHGVDFDKAAKDGNVVTKVILPDSLEYIEDSFKSCKNLKKVNIPESVKYVKLYDWSQEWIKKYTNSDGLIIINNILIDGMNAKGKIKIPSNVVEIAESAFYRNYNGNSEITEVSIPSSVKKIGETAFCNCTSLKKVKISEGIQEIDDDAFGGCISLNDLEIPDNIDNISGTAFSGCTSLNTKPSYKGNGMLVDKFGGLYSGEDAEGDIVIPDNVKEIKNGAFADNTKITSITIPKSVKKIGRRAFSGCSNLKNVTLEEGLEFIGNEAFIYSGIKKIRIPRSIEDFGKDVFLGCSSLEDASNRDNGLIVNKNGVLCSGITAKGDVVIPNEVKEIQEYAFFGNNKIKSLSISGNTKIIRGKAFQDCTSLLKLTLEEGIESIESTAFFNCDKLAEVILPNSIKTIEDNAFGECSSLESVSYKDGLNVNKAFYGTPWDKTKINGGKKVITNDPAQTPVGRQYKNGKWYYYNMDRTSPKGWYFDVPYKSWYYVNNDGSLKTGWFYDNNYGSWFYLDGNGIMKTGWFYDNNYNSWFYLNEDGTMKTGWFYDNSYGHWYYLYSNGMMARSTYINGYYVDRSGAWVR